MSGSDDLTVLPTGSISPEDWARLITKRPGMYLGSSSFERAVGFIHGLEHPMIVRCCTPDDIAALPTSRHRELLRREEGIGEHEAIRRLEPLLVELLTTVRVTEGRRSG